MNCSLPPVRLSRLAQACALSWLFLVFSAAWAAAQGTLTGIVTNSATGATLEGARVVLAGSNREATTDNVGAYRFDNVPVGEATLSVSYTGLSTQEVKATVAATGHTRRDVGLTSDLYLMSKLVVASEREGNAKAITLQRQSEGVRAIVSADAFGGLAGNPADLAIRLPGVEGESVGGDMRYVRIRGLHQNLSSIAQDGNRLADAGSAGATREFQFQTVGSDSVERIEVIKSPTPDFDADSIGGVVNLISKSAFDSSGERRIRASAGAIWRPSDPRDSSRPNGSISYSEVFGGKLGINLNLAYRPHGSIIDMSTQGFQQLPVGVEGPAYQYQLSVQDFRNVRTRSGAGLRLDYKLSDEVRFFVNFQLNKHIEHSDHTQVTWATTQSVATVDASGNFTGTNGIIPGYTDYETSVRPVAGSTVAIFSQSAYKLGKTKTVNLAAIHRYQGFDLDYDLYGSKSKSDYPGNNTFTFTLPGAGWTIRRDDALFPTVTQTAGPDWTRLDSYTQNAYTSAKMVGWDSYLGSSISAKKQFQTRWPSFVKAGLRWREQTRNLDNTPFNYTYVGPDGVMGPNAANGGRNDDNLAQFGQANRAFPDTSIGKYGSIPFPAFQALGRPDDLEGDIAANPGYWRRALATDLQSALVNNQQFTEEIRAAYIMGNVRIGKLNVLTGVRIERTMTEGTGALQVLTPEERARRTAWGTAPVTDAETERRVREEYGRRVTREGDYQGVFPGLHLKYQFKRNWLMRFSYSEAIGRPNIGQLIPRTTVNLDTQSLTTSNPSLEPQWSKNWDIATEYYFEPSGAVSIGVFQKDLKQFIYSAGGEVVGSGPDNGFGGEYVGFTVSTQYNGGRAKVKGLELSYTQQYTFLPGIWKGLGAFANATFMNAEGNYGAGAAIALAPNPRVAGFNPFIANAGVSYIRSKLNLRATFNYRHKYLTTYNANESRAVYFAARPTLDLKALYNINRRIAVYVDVANVLEQEDRETQFGFGRPQTTHRMLRQFFFGVNLRN